MCIFIRTKTARRVTNDKTQAKDKTKASLFSCLAFCIHRFYIHKEKNLNDTKLNGKMQGHTTIHTVFQDAHRQFAT